MADDKYIWELGQPPPPLEEHSEAKHRVFRDYLRRYLEVLTARYGLREFVLTLVDGFAGGGEYSWRGDIAPGSPLLLLEEVAAMRATLAVERTTNFSLDVEFIFVEQKRGAFDYLQKVIQSSPHSHLLESGRIHLVRNNFESALPAIKERIVRRAGGERAIFLLDQYGYNKVSFSAIRGILDDLKNPEVILTFHVDSLIQYLCNQPHFVDGLRPVELRLDDIMNYIAVKDQRNGRLIIQNMLYSHVVQSTGAKFYTPFFIKSPASGWSYWLVHMSKHVKARDEMGKRHWANQNTFIHHGDAGFPMLGFAGNLDELTMRIDFGFDINAAKQSRAALLERFPRAIFDQAKQAGTPLTFEQLFSAYANIMPATTEQAIPVLCELRDSGQIEIVSKDGAKRERTTRIAWSDRILPRAEPTFPGLLLPRSKAPNRA